MAQKIAAVMTRCKFCWSISNNVVYPRRKQPVLPVPTNNHFQIERRTKNGTKDFSQLWKEFNEPPRRICGSSRHGDMSQVSTLPPIRSLELLPTGSTASKKSDLIFESDGGKVQPVTLFIFERTFPFHFFLHGLFPRWMHKIDPTDEKPSICCV